MIPGEPEGLDLLSEECLDIAMAMAAITRASALEMFYGRASGDHPSSAIEDMRGRIPVEIRDDFDIWMDALLDYARIIAGIDVPVTSGDDSSGTDRAMPSQVTSDDPLADPLVVEAQANVSAYLDARCPPVGRSSDEMG